MDHFDQLTAQTTGVTHFVTPCPGSKKGENRRSMETGKSEHHLIKQYRLVKGSMKSTLGPGKVLVLNSRAGSKVHRTFNLFISFFGVSSIPQKGYPLTPA